jgi:hypothetical protein
VSRSSLLRRALRAVPAALPALAVVAARPAAAQLATVDEGSFTISRGGVRVGREEFRIVRQPAGGGAAYMARATGSYGDRRVTPALQTDGDGAPERIPAGGPARWRRRAARLRAGVGVALSAPSR